ncbi:hypothetical protein [Methylovulum psychrotolerans]|uniref:Uncharacterized protein n=1 Tax=Methylovulum psychrotolerans TaxID=1704499 RepID=A0A1Z4BV87_9GAMM|nr:hypothetical protein [Methylovulum psychrotolerans]ASF45211.1 hypothetical protein CEK71_03565 [Methylovulum psychrotolerans]
MLLGEWVNTFYTVERPDVQMLELPTVLAQAVRAVGFYAGYAAIASAPDNNQAIDADTDVSLSVWAVIRPLFLLYVERETALQLEASRMQGIDVFGRSVSEITAEIASIEDGLPYKAFSRPIINL